MEDEGKMSKNKISTRAYLLVANELQWESEEEPFGKKKQK